MRVALISPYLDIYSTGMRTISSCLRKAGHETRQIFLPSASENFERTYPEQIANDVLDLCKDVDVVGFSLMSNHFSKSAALSMAVAAMPTRGAVTPSDMAVPALRIESARDWIFCSAWSVLMTISP